MLCVDDNSRRCSEDPRSPPPTLIVQEYFNDNKINNNQHDEKKNPFFSKKSTQDFCNLESTTDQGNATITSEQITPMSAGAMFMKDLSKHVSKITGLDPEMIPSPNSNPKPGTYAQGRPTLIFIGGALTLLGIPQRTEKYQIWLLFRQTCSILPLI